MLHRIPKIREFMTAAPTCIEPGLGVTKARQRMAELHAHHLPVTHGGELVGMVSAHDLDVLELATQHLGDAASYCTVADAMTERPFTCGPDAHLHAVAAEMAVHHWHSVVIVDPDHPGRVLGVFTTNDALIALSALGAHHEAAE